jgi:CheY-like chemotaxis protein
VKQQDIKNIPDGHLSQSTMRAEPATRVALVVEDEWFVREHIVTELKAQGWSVVETATGESALAVLATDEIHLLLTDIQLAGAIDGWEVARALRAKKPDFPVIYASKPAGLGASR